MSGKASICLTADFALWTSSSYLLGSILTKTSFAGIDPPLLKLGETQTTRPTTSETTVVFLSRVTVPVSLSVSACPVAAGLTMLTTGFAWAGPAMGPRSTLSGALAKYSATTIARRIRAS